MDLFKECIPSLTSKTSNLIDDNPDAEKSYVPFQVNKHFGFSIRSVLFANEMNLAYNLPKKLQYDFYFYGLDKGKLWITWPAAAKAEEKEKKRTLNNIDLIQEYYTCSERRARDYAKILTPADIEIIEKRLFKGEMKQKG